MKGTDPTFETIRCGRGHGQVGSWACLEGAAATHMQPLFMILNLGPDARLFSFFLKIQK